MPSSQRKRGGACGAHIGRELEGSRPGVERERRAGKGRRVPRDRIPGDTCPGGEPGTRGLGASELGPAERKRGLRDPLQPGPRLLPTESSRKQGRRSAARALRPVSSGRTSWGRARNQGARSARVANCGDGAGPTRPTSSGTSSAPSREQQIAKAAKRGESRGTGTLRTYILWGSPVPGGLRAPALCSGG